HQSQFSLAVLRVDPEEGDEANPVAPLIAYHPEQGSLAPIACEPCSHLRARWHDLCDPIARNVRVGPPTAHVVEIGLPQRGERDAVALEEAGSGGVRATIVGTS